MLTIEKLTSGYSGNEVLHQLTMTVRPGQIVAVLGANGAGKTTLMNTISGLVPTRSGRIGFDGTDINGMKPEAIVARGLSQVPQGRRIFPGLTVYENMVVAQTAATHRSPGGFKSILKEIFELFPRLEERREQLGWSLSGGEQQMLAVARALVARPKLILLDEPSLGLAPLVFTMLFDAIKEINKRDETAFLLVEQNAEQALRIADYVYVIELGTIVVQGEAEQVAQNPAIEEAYLGA